jgi:hypothetical protein
MGLPEAQAQHMRATIKGAHLLEAGADPLETGLLCSLLRASPEVKRLLEWASSSRPPSGVVPLHAGSFALLGAVYFHARLVRFDAALASRAVDDYGVEVRGTKDLKVNFLKFLDAMAREPNSLVGFLAPREYQDTNSVVHMHVLGGILAPLFAEISRELRARKQTAFGRALGKIFGDSIPSHLSDVVILEAIQHGHVEVLKQLCRACDEQDRSDQAAAEQEAASKQKVEEEKKEEQQRLEAEEKRRQQEKEYEERVAEQKRSLAATREKQVAVVTANLAGLFGAFSEDLSAQVQTQRYQDAARTVLRASWDIVSKAPEVSDEALYLLLDKLPRGMSVKSPGVMDRALKATNDLLYQDRRASLPTSPEESLSIGILYETLARIVIIKSPERFYKFPSEMVRYLSANSDYGTQILADIRRALIQLHSQKSMELVPN